MGEETKESKNLASSWPPDGESVLCGAEECPDNGITRDPGAIVSPLHVFVPMRLSWL